MKRTVEEFKTLLNENNLKCMHLYYKDSYVGCVTSDMEYDASKAQRKYKMTQYAIDQALNEIDAYIEQIKLLRSDEQVSVKTIYFNDYKEDFKLVETGTYDSIFEKIEYANDHLRYCNGSYYRFASPKISQLFSLWRRCIPESRSFDLYYGNGTVD